MKRRRYAEDLEIGDPPSNVERRMPRLPGLGEAGPSHWAGRWIHDEEDETCVGGDARDGEIVDDQHAKQRLYPSQGRNQVGSSTFHTVSAVLAIGGALSWIPEVHAAPPPTRRMARPSRITSPPEIPPVKRHDLQYLGEKETPSTLPSGSTVLAESYLPYVLSRMEDGSWSKLDNGWSLYGRQAGPTGVILVDDPNATGTDTATASSSWAIEQSLPTGWGQTSNRTDFYQIPLISVASVILAVGIVVGIILIVFNRRKAHRRAKRRAERKRRKALAAAGYTEDEINGNTAGAALNEKLLELEGKHRSKSNKKGPTAMVRVKVKAWHSTIRRRKGGKKDGDEASLEVVPEEEDKPVDSPQEPERPSVESSHHGSTTDEQPSTMTRGANDSPTTTQSSDSTGTSDIPPVHPVTFFPPAYRPASIRSLRVTPTAGSSTSAAPPPTQVEKTRAPGYYPAPVTEDSEIALAVASRSDGKARMVTETEEDERAEHVRHIATDDKTELERMRLGASAPSGSAGFGGAADGPSAPNVDLDEHGFERIPLDEAGPSGPPLAPAPPLASGLLPAPPTHRHTSYRSFGDAAVERDVDETLDELNLLPSAPPSAGVLAPSAPSAPEIEETDEHMPSAPPLPEDDDEEESHEQIVPGHEPAETSTHVRTASAGSSSNTTTDQAQATSNLTVDGENGNRGQGESITRRLSPGVVFLPRYEP